MEQGDIGGLAAVPAGVASNRHGHGPHGPLMPGIELDEVFDDHMRSLRHGTMWWIEHSREWFKHDRDPAFGSVSLCFMPKQGEDLSELEKQLNAGEREAPDFELPLDLLEPARLCEIEAAIKRAAAALSWDASEAEEKRKRQKDEWGEIINEKGMAAFEEAANRHPGRWLETPSGVQAYIDEGMIGACKTLWAEGIETLACCQGDPEYGGLYLMGKGRMPLPLRMAVMNAGFEHDDGLRSGRWTFWDSAPRHLRKEFHQKAKLLIEDVASKGLLGIDRSGASYRPEVIPPPDLDQWLKALEERIAARQGEKK